MLFLGVKFVLLYGHNPVVRCSLDRKKKQGLSEPPAEQKKTKTDAEQKQKRDTFVFPPIIHELRIFLCTQKANFSAISEHLSFMEIILPPRRCGISTRVRYLRTCAWLSEEEECSQTDLGTGFERNKFCIHVFAQCRILVLCIWMGFFSFWLYRRQKSILYFR